MKSKNLKVTYASRYSPKQSSLVPMIRMEGKWLEALGFSIGTRIKVEYREGSICLRPLTEEEISALEYQELQNEISHKQKQIHSLESSLSSFHPVFSKVAEPTSAYHSNPSKKIR